MWLDAFASGSVSQVILVLGEGLTKSDSEPGRTLICQALGEDDSLLSLDSHT